MLFRIFTILCMILTGAAAARESSYGGMTGSYGGSAAGLSNATTRAVVRTIRRETVYCLSVEAVYWYDCCRQAYTFASKQLNGQPSYAEAQKALDIIVGSLDRTVRRNGDPATPAKRRNLQSYAPIKPAAVAQARKDFIVALDEAETILLRSAEKGNVHFARIAEAVHSNKVLLRALLNSPAGAPIRFALALARAVRPLA